MSNTSISSNQPGNKTDEDKFSAVWLSHSSISDFLRCPRLYYFANIYKNPKSGRKITIMNPALALGQAVHGVLDVLSRKPTGNRFDEPLNQLLDKEWKKVSGKLGGFSSEAQEAEYKERAEELLKKIEENPGPINRKALKIKQDLPHYWFSEKENLILCGKIDWIEYVDRTDGVHIIDFKTGRRRERSDSLQLPIYYLLAKNCQSRIVEKMSYWYLDSDDSPEEVDMPDEDESKERIKKIGMRIKLARQLNHFHCDKDKEHGCPACSPFETVTKGQGEFVGVGEYNREVYILPDDAVSL